MRLVRKSTSEAVSLEDGFLWSDEFSWKAIEQNQAYAIDGALIIQEGKKKSGRPITLQPADQEMGWIKLHELRTLRDWSVLQGENFRLQFEQPHDNRQFTVKFNHQDGDDYYNVTLRFLELENAD